MKQLITNVLQPTQKHIIYDIVYVSGKNRAHLLINYSYISNLHENY